MRRRLDHLARSAFTTAAILMAASLPGRAAADDGFLPHAVCYLWDAGLLLLHAVTDGLIGLSYVAISATLGYLVYRARRDIPFHWIVLAFGAFIVACGMTHFMELWTLWSPRYWLAGQIKAATAVASVATALALPPLVPRALALIEAAKLSDQRQRRLEAAHGELEGLYGRVTEVDRLKTQFFANVSHELRTPLALILGPVEQLLGSTPLTPDQEQALTVVQGNARLLLRQVNDLLDVSKIEAGKMGLAYAQLDLTQLVRLTAGHFEGLAAERGIDYVIDAPARLPAQVDSDKIQRVLLNLLANAFKFTPDGGRIRVTLAAGARGMLTVADSGPGVAPALRQEIFDRFRQGDEGPARRFGGTGLGLAIARDFVELHGGRITVDDAALGGAAFVVDLPLTAPRGALVHVAPGVAAERDAALLALEAARAQRRTDRDVAAAAEPGGPGPETDPDGRPCVLVVEDNAEMKRFLVELLAPDYRVVTAADGADALGRLRTVAPDLILTDIMMPEVSGDELVREVRGRPALANVPIVVLTAKADDELRARLLREGAQDYVTKPVASEELRVRLGNLLAMKRARDVLQRELASQTNDVAALVEQIAERTRALQAAEAAVREQREWFRVTIRSIGDAVIVTDAAGRVVLMNPVAEAVTGWPEGEAAGRATDDVFRIVNERTGAPVESPIARVLREGRVVGLANHTALVTRDGDKVPIDDSGAPIRTEADALVGVVLVFRDVTERRRAEEARVRLAEIVRSSDDAIISKDLDGIITSWNPAAERLFGFTGEEAIGQRITLVIPPERHGEEEEVLRRIRRGEAVDHFETVRVRKDGTRLEISLTVSPVRDPAGEIIGASKIARDIGDRKRADVERTALLEREQTARAEAEAANRAKDQFLATLSHELRNPLQAILGWAQAMRTFRGDPATLDRAVDTIQRNARAQVRLIEDLLDVSRIIAGQLRLAVQPVYLAPVIRAAIESLAPAAEAKAIRVASVLDSEAGPVSGDADRLQQIVWNLLSNAVKFTPKGGRVQVTLERVNSHVEIRVTDTGPGIRPEFFPYVFERFRQAEGGPSRPHGGLGLGLAIVRQLVELHGGTVHVESQGEGQGAVFTVRLPLRPLVPSEERVVPEPAVEQAASAATPSALAGVHVLLVEDESDSRDLLETVIEHAGATVDAVASVPDALDAFDRRRPDVVVSDIEMPGENGYALIRRLRGLEAGAARDVPAIALTAYARVEDRMRALTAGFDAHVAKPVAPGELIALVAALARRRRA